MSKKKNLLIDNYAFVATKPQLTESSDGSGDYIIEGEFGMVDKKNANNRIYPREIMEREIKSFNERLGGRGVLGELDHPEDGKTKLVRSSHVIEELWLNEDGKIMGRARVVPTTKGKDLLALYQSKAPVGISSRGYGSTMTTEEGVDVVQTDFELKTFDFVEDPSAGVYPELVTESVNDNGDKVIEALSEEEAEKVKEELGIKEEVLDDEGEEYEADEDEKSSEDSKEDDKEELEKGSESEADEAKDVEDSQADTSGDISSKMDDEEETQEESEEETVDKEQLESAKAQLNVTLNKIEEAKAQLEKIRVEKGDSAILEGVKQLLSPVMSESAMADKVKELEEKNAELEENNRILREENEVHVTRNRKLAESLDRTVRRLYLEQTVNELGLHNQEVFFENFDYDSYEKISDFKDGLLEAKKKVKEIYGDTFMNHEDLVESVETMVEKGKDLEIEVKKLTEEKGTLNNELLFERRKQTVKKDLEDKGLLEGYSNKEEIIEAVAKKEKANLLETKQIIKESGVAFKKVPDYTKEKGGTLRAKLKGFSSDRLDEEIESPKDLYENVNGVNMKEFDVLAGNK